MAEVITIIIKQRPGKKPSHSPTVLQSHSPTAKRHKWCQVSEILKRNTKLPDPTYNSQYNSWKTISPLPTKTTVHPLT